MKNKYEIRGDITVIFLDRADGSSLETLIDTVDLDLAREFQGKWVAQFSKCTKTYYAAGYTPYKEGKRKYFRLHRWITKVKDDAVVDHINHDTLDNRTVNLRQVTRQQNNQNKIGAYSTSKSGIRGVHWYKNYSKWVAGVRINGKKIHLGYFDFIEQAEIAVKEARERYLPYSIN